MFNIFKYFRRFASIFKGEKSVFYILVTALDRSFL